MIDSRDSPAGPGHAPATAVLDDDVLRGWPLPMPGTDGDKEERGRVLVVAGSREIGGAALLAGSAALRAGAGKLALATVERLASGLALAIPEARVIGLPETGQGGISASAASLLADWSGDAVLFGPGFMDEDESCRLVESLLPRFGSCAVVLDALAMSAVARNGGVASPVLITPHPGEMAHLTGLAKEEIEANPDEVARQYAARWNVIVALKGARTSIAAPDGRTWVNEAGNSGLATSGSGDALAGIVCGLAARGSPLEQAAAWGVGLHARAGERLARRYGPLGFLARELSGELPSLMQALAP